MISALNYIPTTHNNVHLIKVRLDARKKGVDTLHSYQNGQSEIHKKEPAI